MSSSRNKGSRRNPRSPAVPSFQEQGHPRFLPPSYYAASAGLPYPADQTDGNAGHSTTRTESEQSTFFRSPAQDSPIPVSHLSDSSNSDSYCFVSQPSNMDRSSSVSSKKSFQSFLSSKSGHSVKRQVQLESIEAQLLPSLQDTIDRMTHPASPMLSPTPPSFVPSQLFSPAVDSRSRVDRSPFISSPSASSGPRSTSALAYSTPKVSQTSKIVTPSSVSTPKGKVRSILKSTPDMRAAGASLKSPSTPGTRSDETPMSPSTRSLRSVRSVIGNVKKAHVESMTSGAGEGANEDSGAGPHTKSSSRRQKTNLSEPSEDTPRLRSRTAPSVDPTSPTPLRSMTQPVSLVSSLPRRLASLASSSTNGSKNPDHYSNKNKTPRPREGSSSEIDYDVDGRNKRVLVITNAVVVPSSSEESEGECGHGNKSGIPSRLPVIAGRYASEKYDNRKILAANSGLARRQVGLGLDMTDVVSDQEDSAQTGMKIQDDVGTGDDESVYEDEPEETETVQPSWGIDHMRAANWEHAESDQEREMSEDEDEARRKRREALVGIVSGIQSMATLSGVGQVGLPSDSDIRSSCGEHAGVALSGSNDFWEMPENGTPQNEGSEESDRDNDGSKHTEDEDASESDYSEEEDTACSMESPGHVRRKCVEGDNDARHLETPKLVLSESNEHQDRPRRRSVTPSQIHYQMISGTGRPLSLPAVPRRPERPAEPLFPLADFGNHSVTPVPSAMSSDRKRNSYSSSVKDRKKPSKSPGFRHSMASTMPSTPRRYSVYEQSQEAFDKHKQNQGDLLDARSFANEQTREETQSYLDEQESHESHRRLTERQESLIMLSNSDSSSSSVGGDDRWREERGSFSTGAQAMFKDLQEFRKSSSDRSDEAGRRRSGGHSGVPSVHKDDAIEGSAERSDPHSGHETVSGSGTLRSTLSSSTCHSLIECLGESEMRRQEIISEFYEGQREFSERLRSVVCLFIQPLRTQDRKSWIQGVPSEIARFFDWYEDIVNLHVQISSALHSAKAIQRSIVYRVAEVMRRFVPKLEVYQPYLVKLDAVIGMVGRIVRDAKSDLGEFIRMQEKNADLSLETLLLEPETRLRQYPQFFRRLWEVTPKTHPDYLPTFSLLHSTEMIIQVMREVKIREDEYDNAKEICSRIDGLQSSSLLAKRERRLLTQGLLDVFDLDGKQNTGMSAMSMSQELGDIESNFAVETARRTRDASRQSRLGNAIQEWDLRRSRSGSMDSTASSVQSFDSHESALCGGLTYTMTPSSAGYSDSGTLLSPSPASGKSELFQETVDLSRTQEQFSLSSSRSKDISQKTSVYAIVFTDLIVLTTPADGRPVESLSGIGQNNWRLLDNVGMARILGVTGSLDEGRSITLDLLPMDAKQLETGVISDEASIVTVRFSVPTCSTFVDQHTASDPWSIWLTALQKCYRHTLRSLSFPSHSGQYLAHGPSVDLESDTRQTMMSILASGLPLPKSPSIQIEEVRSLQDYHTSQLEREERGWWALRFQQVFREMQRKDEPLPLSSTSDSLRLRIRQRDQGCFLPHLQDPMSQRPP